MIGKCDKSEAAWLARFLVGDNIAFLQCSHNLITYDKHNIAPQFRQTAKSTRGTFRLCDPRAHPTRTVSLSSCPQMRIGSETVFTTFV